MQKEEEQVRLSKQAVAFCKYLIRQPVADTLKERYIKALTANPKLQPSEEKLLNFATSHTCSIGMLDGGLAIIRPQSELRRRIFIMLAILEATPEHAARFLPQQRGAGYAFLVALSAARAIFRAAAGIVIVKALRV